MGIAQKQIVGGARRECDRQLHLRRTVQKSADPRQFGAQPQRGVVLAPLERHDRLRRNARRERIAAPLSHETRVIGRQTQRHDVVQPIGISQRHRLVLQTFVEPERSPAAGEQMLHVELVVTGGGVGRLVRKGKERSRHLRLLPAEKPRRGIVEDGIRIGRCHRLDAAHAQRPGIGIRNPVRLRRNGEEPAGERRHPKNQSFHILFVKSKRGGRACGPPPRPYRDSLPTVSSSSRRSSG